MKTNTQGHCERIKQRDGSRAEAPPTRRSTAFSRPDSASVTSATCSTRLASPSAGSSSSQPTPTPRPATSCSPSPPPRACGSSTPSRTSTWSSPPRMPSPTRSCWSPRSCRRCHQLVQGSRWDPEDRGELQGVQRGPGEAYKVLHTIDLCKICISNQLSPVACLDSVLNAISMPAAPGAKRASRLHLKQSLDSYLSELMSCYEAPGAGRRAS